MNLNLKSKNTEFNMVSKLTKIINWTGTLLGLWTIFNPTPYKHIVITAILFPLIVITLLKKNNEVIRLDEKAGNKHPSIFFGFLLPSLSVGIRGILDFNIYNYFNVWIFSIFLTLFLLTVLMFKQKEFNLKRSKDRAVVTGITLFLFIYSFGSVILVNCIFDNNRSEVYYTVILNKRISSGKTNTYYLKLSPWGNRYDTYEARVGRGFYDRAEAGEEIVVQYMKGKLNIPWIKFKDLKKHNDILSPFRK